MLTWLAAIAMVILWTLMWVWKTITILKMLQRALEDHRDERDWEGSLTPELPSEPLQPGRRADVRAANGPDRRRSHFRPVQ